MKKILLAAMVFLAVGYFAGRNHWSPDRPTTVTGIESATGDQSDDILKRAYEKRESDLQVQGEGIVQKVLRDDNEGSRHQRFLLRLSSGQTLLIAHNVDLAPRIQAIRAGDVVTFHGEYEWNSKGGVIHWTHRDPQGRHVPGWLEHNGRRYQ